MAATICPSINYLSQFMVSENCIYYLEKDGSSCWLFCYLTNEQKFLTCVTPFKQACLYKLDGQVMIFSCTNNGFCSHSVTPRFKDHKLLANPEQLRFFAYHNEDVILLKSAVFDCLKSSDCFSKSDHIVFFPYAAAFNTKTQQTFITEENPISESENVCSVFVADSRYHYVDAGTEQVHSINLCDEKDVEVYKIVREHNVKMPNAAKSLVFDQFVVFHRREMKWKFSDITDLLVELVTLKDPKRVEDVKVASVSQDKNLLHIMLTWTKTRNLVITLTEEEIWTAYCGNCSTEPESVALEIEPLMEDQVGQHETAEQDPESDESELVESREFAETDADHIEEQYVENDTCKSESESPEETISETENHEDHATEPILVIEKTNTSDPANALLFDPVSFDSNAEVRNADPVQENTQSLADLINAEMAEMKTSPANSEAQEAKQLQDVWINSPYYQNELNENEDQCLRQQSTKCFQDQSVPSPKSSAQTQRK
ncbi:hypothetical protein L596_028936 [Steinernema carpocapsae]|uniref:Uncharacterized protein n=1 Tax=Steinernema carpocapsae TaxID=34508 RepID=A0A4V5ZY12_STECR|nr:hypothetical protein L596_028936 [Steinernema carpocapsae]